VIFLFEDTPIFVTPADRPTCSMYLRDLPVEISDASARPVFEAFGDVFFVRAAVFKDFPSIRNGTRILLMPVKQSIPSSLNVLGFMCRTWYPGQPVYCSICRQPGHLPRACPLSGLCRRCKQPGHVARECVQVSVSTPSVPSPPSKPSPPPDSSPPSSLPDPAPSTESTPPTVFPSVPVSVPVSFPARITDVVISSAPRVPPVPQPLDPVDDKEAYPFDVDQSKTWL